MDQTPPSDPRQFDGWGLHCDEKTPSFDGPFGSNCEMGQGQGRSTPNHLPLKRKYSNNDFSDGGSNVKLYVGRVPNTVTQEQVGSLFQTYGSVLEVILGRDKITGCQREYCFVKYATLDEADNAIRSLHEKHIWPGGVEPLKVKYADGEKECLGTNEHRVYVQGLNKQASQEEIANLFSQYGIVEDVCIMLDDFKQSRGCGFVGFRQQDMAMSAIDALNETYVMKGCVRPLVVRLADPKKPRNMDLRPDTASPVASPVASHMFSCSSSHPSAENTPTIHSGPTLSQMPHSSESNQPLHQQMHSNDSPSSSGPVSSNEHRQLAGSASARSNSAAASPQSAFPSVSESAIVEHIPKCDLSKWKGLSQDKDCHNGVSSESKGVKEIRLKYADGEKECLVGCASQIIEVAQRNNGAHQLSEVTNVNEVDTGAVENVGQCEANTGKRENGIVAESTTDGLPFSRRSPFWDMLESMAVFEQLPQKPHFHPLYDCKEQFREGLAIGSMVTYSGLVGKIPGLQLDVSKTILEDMMETTLDLENHGFDVESMKERLGLLLEIKNKHEQDWNQSKEIDTLITELHQETAKLEVEIDEIDHKLLELRERRAFTLLEKGRKELENLAALELRVQTTQETLEGTSSEFERVATAPW